MSGGGSRRSSSVPPTLADGLADTGGLRGERTPDVIERHQMIHRPDGRKRRYRIEKQAACEIRQALGGDAGKPFHHFLVRNGAAIEHHLPGDLAGAGSRALLAHQQLRADLRP